MSRPLVIKIGGSTLGQADTTYADIATLVKQGTVPVVVHGGGAEASKWLERMGIPSRFERGLRVTDADVLPVVVAVFAGLVNKRIVTALNAAGAPAVGLCGADGRLLECDITAADLGFVGDPQTVHPEAISALLAGGLVPVISSIGYVAADGPDQLVNVNADTVAGSVAGALGAEEVLFLTDVEGVRGPEETVLAELSASRARELIGSGVIAGGMIPKVEACLHAASHGVRARILDGRLPGAILEASSRGTLITP